MDPLGNGQTRGKEVTREAAVVADEETTGKAVTADEENTRKVEMIYVPVEVESVMMGVAAGQSSDEGCASRS